MKRFEGVATRALLGLANGKHRTPEPNELAPVPDNHAEGAPVDL
jgi:hypothetical protein